VLDPDMIELSRWQFAITALYHFLFVPLTIGMTWILVIMESVYVMTGKQIYKDMTKFWGKLFGINFALGVTTGLTMEFEFGTNWAYYSHYVGDVFGAPLAIEGLMAFFLESTFVGMFFLGWERLTKVQHLMVTFLTALGTNLSALWILVANGWMQNPVGAEFSLETMRMEMTSFSEVFLNPVAQVKFIHTVSAGYVTASMFVAGISAYYLLKKRDLGFARRSMAIALGFGMASILSVILLGDESGYEMGDVQRMKLAAVEAEWHTEEAPAAFTVIGYPNDETMETEHAVKIPYALGLVATRSISEEVPGIHDLIEENESRIRAGMVAYRSMMAIRSGKADEMDNALFEMYKKDMGYALLLKQFTPKVIDATEEQIKAAARGTVPDVTLMFFTFRVMVACGFWMLLLIGTGFILNARRRLEKHRWILGLFVLSIPVPWIAVETGWFVAEYGRQPWAIGEVLPTFLATSSLEYNDIVISLIGFITFYTLLAIIEMYLMVKFARLGPSALHTGRYHFEKSVGAGGAIASPAARKEDV
jgi:cytochrome d ubiquinol oxidase subunit I